MVSIYCRTSGTNGVSRHSEELRADPGALANGAYDAPAKPNKGKTVEAGVNGPSSNAAPSATATAQSMCI